MRIFTLRIFERSGADKSCELRFLGQRQYEASNIVEGKRWLSQLIAAGQLHGDRFYQFQSLDSILSTSGQAALNIAFYLFADRRLCPLRIWSSHELAAVRGCDAEWVVDFEGIPGWSFIGSVEPRWHKLQTVPPERSWMGRSHRDWQKRDCWVLSKAAASTRDIAA